MRIAVLYSFEPQAGIIYGFREQGYEVISFFYGIDKPSIFRRIYWKFFNTPDSYINNEFNKQLGKIYNEHQLKPFNLLLIIKGKEVNENSKSILLKMHKIYKILWTTDSVIRFPDQLMVEKYMDKIFVQDGSDINLVKNSEWLPLGFDKNLYFYKKDKSIDILLFGNCNIKYYSKRLNYVKEASKLADRYNIIFVGSNLSIKDEKEIETNGVKVYKMAPFNKFVELITSAKICVNIHQDDGGKAINPLFFAIPASGSVQITDRRQYYSEWLIKGENYFEVNLEDLNHFIENMLLNFKKNQPSKKSIMNIIDKDSFVGRAKVLLGGFVEKKQFKL